MHIHRRLNPTSVSDNGGRNGRSLIGGKKWRAIADLLRLSNREYEIVQCIFDDMSEKNIANGLGISPHTVHTYVERLYRKLNVNSRCGLLLSIFAAFVALGSHEPTRIFDRAPTNGQGLSLHSSRKI